MGNTVELLDPDGRAGLTVAVPLDPTPLPELPPVPPPPPPPLPDIIEIIVESTAGETEVVPGVPCPIPIPDVAHIKYTT